MRRRWKIIGGAAPLRLCNRCLPDAGRLSSPRVLSAKSAKAESLFAQLRHRREFRQEVSASIERAPILTFAVRSMSRGLADVAGNFLHRLNECPRWPLRATDSAYSPLRKPTAWFRTRPKRAEAQ
jgi:hypothetical protein